MLCEGKLQNLPFNNRFFRGWPVWKRSVSLRRPKFLAWANIGPLQHITMHSMGEEEKIDGESPCYARYENLHKIDGRYLSGNTYYFISSHSRNRKTDIFSFLKFQTVQRERTSVLNVLLYANIS